MLKFTKQSGYTLLELSISLSIIAIMITAGLTVFNRVDDGKRTKLTIERQAKIQAALANYVLENNYLPCPAPSGALENSAIFGVATAYNPTITSTNIKAVAVAGATGQLVASDTSFAGFGAGTVITVAGFTNAANNGSFTITAVDSPVTTLTLSSTTGNTMVAENSGATETITMTTHSCSSNTIVNETGMVPTHDLKLTDDYAYDGWDRKFTYRMADGMGKNTVVGDANNNLNDFINPIFMGDISITDINGNEKTDINRPAPNNMGAAYVLISHGPNGWGAWMRNSTTTPVVPAAANDSRELENLNHGVNKIYIQNPRTSSTNGITGASFDDIVVYKRKSDIQPQIRQQAPFRIASTTCNNAQAIVTQGEAVVSPTAWLGGFRTSTSPSMTNENLTFTPADNTTNPPTPAFFTLSSTTNISSVNPGDLISVSDPGNSGVVFSVISATTSPQQINVVGNVKQTLNCSSCNITAANTNRATIADQLYASARAVNNLCNNQPSAVLAANQGITNQVSTCAMTPFSVQSPYLQLWLDANDINGSGNLLPNGTGVGTWYDKSGNANNVTQGAAAPTFVLNAINGRPAVRFSGSLQYLATSTSVGANLLPQLDSTTQNVTGDATIFIVASSKTASANEPALKVSGTGSIPFDVYLPKSGGAAATWDFGTGDTVSGAWGGSLSTPTVWSLQVSHSNSSTNPMAIFRNGTQVVSTLNQAGAYTYTTNAVLNVGFDGAATYFSGDIGEVIIYSAYLANSDRQNIEQYLEMKWGTVAGAACPSGYSY